MPAVRTSGLDHLLDAVIDSAPDCVRQRVLLRAVNWSAVSPARVARLIGKLEAESIALPPWLAASLLTAGHSLSGVHLSALGPVLGALNSLNRLRRPVHAQPATTDARTAAQELIWCDEIDTEIAVAAVKQLLALDEPELAARVGLAHWRATPQLLRLVQKHSARLRESFADIRLRVAGISNAQAFAADLPVAFAAVGYDASIEESDYGQAFAELLQPGDAPRDALLVLLDLEGLSPRDWRQDVHLALDAMTQRLELLASAIESYAASGSGPVLLNSIPAAFAPAAGFIDGHHASGTARAIHHINARLYDIARQNSQVIIVDTHYALGDIAPRSWSDPKLQFYGRMPYSADATRHLASAFATTFRGLKRGAAKVLALDLDDTLWGGIFGEDGVAKLKCDEEFPGNAYRALQEECLRLKGQGMLLTLLSKNNPDAITAFANHPGMLLREYDFVGIRINWEPKASNIRNLAEELNLGLDSFIFLDDSPHERDAMRRMCPEVMVPELPDDPAARPSWLRRLPVTWPVRLTEEDGRRNEMYQAERLRSELRQTTSGLTDYLRGLEQSLIVENVSPATIARAAQLHLRTNQFNLTTERYEEATLQAMMGEPHRHVLLIGRALDKFGDHGLAICATASIEGGVATIQSFLMSCRIIGRGIEAAFLVEVLKALQERGAHRVAAVYIPTQKNAIARSFYADQGFAAIGADGDVTRWGRDLTAGTPIAHGGLISVRRD